MTLFGLPSIINFVWIFCGGFALGAGWALGNWCVSRGLSRFG
jgi:uncharacterized membrane protein YccF (DUF307 family)